MRHNIITAIFISLVSVSLVGLVGGCDEGDSETVSGVEEATVAQTASASLDIEGMTCVSCAASIEDAFDATDGILSGDVDFGEERADVEYDAEVLDEAAIVEIIEDADFEAAVVDGGDR